MRQSGGRQSGGRRSGGRRTGLAIAGSVGAHLALLVALLIHRWNLDLPPEPPDSPWERVMTVELAPRPHASTGGAHPLPVLGRAPRGGDAPLPSPPRAETPATTAPAQVAAAGPPVAAAQPSGGGAGGAGAGMDLGAILRRGVLGCANLAGLGREARERCEEKLGAGAKHEPVLAEGRDPRIQAYYDAVAKAKAPDKPWTPIRAIGAMGVTEDVPRASNDHVAMFGCAVPLGGGGKRKLPSHWLKLGPCVIVPPKGPLTVEVDITPPDQDLSHPPPRSGPRPAPGARHENAAGAPTSKPTLERDDGKDADGETPPR